MNETPAVSATEAWPIGTELEDVAQRARLLIAFADGQEEAGFMMTARRMRVVARDTLELAREVHYYRTATFRELELPADLECDACGRKTWSRSERPGRACGMRQPDDRLCAGLLRPIQATNGSEP